MEKNAWDGGGRFHGRRIQGIGKIVFGVIWCGVVTALLILAYQKMIVPAEASKKWTAVPCTIIESKVLEGKDDEGDATYSFSARYRYVVGGVTYEGGRYQVTTISSNDRAPSEALVKRYPVGSSQTAYYDPADPRKAVLIRGEASTVWYLLIFLGAFELVGIGFVLRGLGLLGRRR